MSYFAKVFQIIYMNNVFFLTITKITIKLSIDEKF